MRIQSRQHRSVSSEGSHECQKAGFSPGKDFSGSTNVTASGLTCQHWAASEPHIPKYTDVGKVGDTVAGEHNQCRNPSDNPRGVWCYTMDPDTRLEYCSVPICALKVFDFSADNDQEPDSNGEYTSATLNVGLALPESFTI